MRGILRERVIAPLRKLLRTGITPTQIALSIATGIVVGIFPVLGTTTALCVFLSLTLRLNMVAMQAFNWLMAGPQLLLLLPFIRLGEYITGSPPIPVTMEELEALYEAGMLAAMRTMGISLLHALAGWSIVAPLLFACTSLMARPLIVRMSNRPRA